jgi:hypothetical protein
VSYWITSLLFLLLVVSIIFHISNFIKKKKRERELWNKALEEEETRLNKGKSQKNKDKGKADDSDEVKLDE